MQNQKATMYFWRTYDQAEIDLVENINGKLSIFEFKSGIKRMKPFPESFKKAYPVNHEITISPSNFFNLLNDFQN